MPDDTPQTVVIAGATSGFGAALARELAACGAQVVIAGRRADRAKAIARSIGEGNALGLECDVRREADLARLWESAVTRFGRIDHWINNAALGHRRRRIDDIPAGRAETVLMTNLGGALLGARQALVGMTQQGSGRIWLTEGLGSSGPTMVGTSVYGASKSGATYAFRVLAKECGNTAITVGFLRPGIMATEVTSGEDEPMPPLAHRLSDPPEVIAQHFAPRILRARRNGQRIAWLTPLRMMAHIISGESRSAKRSSTCNSSAPVQRGAR